VFHGLSESGAKRLCAQTKKEGYKSRPAEKRFFNMSNGTPVAGFRFVQSKKYEQNTFDPVRALSPGTTATVLKNRPNSNLTSLAVAEPTRAAPKLSVNTPCLLNSDASVHFLA
jgi:hypothetical protein